MTKRLHLVFGGDLKDPQRSEFANTDDIEVVGIFPDYATAHAAWRSASQSAVDNARRRYFIAHLHRLRDEEREGDADAASM